MNEDLLKEIITYFKPPREFFSFWDIEDFLIKFKVIKNSNYLFLISKTTSEENELNTRIVEKFSKIPKKAIILFILEIEQSQKNLYKKIQEEWRSFRGLSSRTLNGIRIAKENNLNWELNEELTNENSIYFIKELK